MAKNNSISNKNLAIMLFIGLAIQELLPRIPFIGSLTWVGTTLILVAAVLLLLK